ncbi:MAG: hypothetical protein ABJF50_13070 [Paracoccaceae bacterium]
MKTDLFVVIWKSRVLSAETPCEKRHTLKSIIAVLVLATGILYALGNFGIGPMSMIGGLAMGKEINSLIGNFSIGYCASYICNLTFSPKGLVR